MHLSSIHSVNQSMLSMCAVEDANDENDGDEMEEGEISMQLREHDDTLMAFKNLRWLNRIRYAIINNIVNKNVHE